MRATLHARPGALAAPARGLRGSAARRSSSPARPAHRPRASADDAAASPPASPSSASAPPAPPRLACPICLRPFPNPASLTCDRCSRSFPLERGVANLCLDAGGASGAYKEPGLGKSGTTLFQSDLIAGAYENGWRQSFAWAGFPGEEIEAGYALDFMRDAGCVGGAVLDVSCGSGLFARRFARSRAFSRVVASDFSESMLRTARELCEKDADVDVADGIAFETRDAADTSSGFDDATRSINTVVSFVRADVGRLPFASGSVDAVHAGAAMHCWPSPSAAVAEIARVLRPGGVFVASTFLDPSAMLEDAMGGENDLTGGLSALIRESGAGTGGAFNQFWSERELRDLVVGMCALTEFRRRRERQFIMFSARKPGGDVA